MVAVVDDILTVGPEITSEEVGRAQGIFASADQNNFGLLMAFNFVFTKGEFSGSTVSMYGRNPIFSKVREMPIIGGTPRITIPEVLGDAWFKKNYKPAVFEEKEEANLDDVDAVFKDSEEHHVTEKKEEQPTSMNAFELISMSRALDLGNLFEEEEGFKRETRFAAKGAANDLVQKIEEASKPLGFDIQKKNYKMRLENVTAGRKGNLRVATEIFQVSPSLHMIEVRKTKGDTLEFHKFYKKLSTSLNDVVWKSGESSGLSK